MSAQGTLQRNGTPVSVHDAVARGDRLRLGPNSRAAILICRTNTVLRLDQGTELQLDSSGAGETLLEMIRGAIYFFSNKPQSLDFETPFVNASVRGTEFLIRLGIDRTLLSVFYGEVLAANAQGQLTVSSGQSAEAVRGAAPRLRAVATPSDAVQWALYYQPLLLSAAPDAPAALADAAAALARGDVAAAFERQARVPAARRTPEYYAHEAGLLLSVGRVTDARRSLERARQLPLARSLRVTVQVAGAVTRAQRESALTDARVLARDAPDFAPAWIALSYAQQSLFDLVGALESVREATRVSPGNWWALARLAELWLSQGDVEKAVGTAEQAASIGPGASLTHSVLGFARLTKHEFDLARQSFEAAIERDSANPLARLGLGLARIRKGDLDAGRRELEIAVGLDPRNSVNRSYLGKLYFDERDDGNASDQYGIAKELDPLDPTPWFYDAIRKQTVNRPVEALRDLQKSIELNDNRAVYRSSLLLDQDVAARSASLGRIYSDLGFRQRGLVEGWNSTEAAPGDFSGHRFLADTYAVLPRHEAARVSELLQSQLLQPLSVAPVQPQLAETSLFILEEAGPAVQSFSEFHPLFLGNRLGIQGSAVAGGNSTIGGEVTQSGIWDNVSYSVGYFHYDTDGFRQNNDQTLKIFNAFVQASPTYNSSVQVEVRSSDAERGDLPLLFDPDNFNPGKREDEEFVSLRVGGRYDFSHRSKLIASVIYGEREDDITIPFSSTMLGLSGSLDTKTESDSWQAEIRHLYEGDAFRATAGVGYFDADGDEQRVTVTNIPGVPFPVTRGLRFDRDVEHTNLYSYWWIDVTDEVTLTLGASGDFFKAAGLERNQFNPKLGITLKPAAGTTIRGAAFRTLKRSVVSDSTIEPTHVAGFNQFFDGVEAEDAWRYGLAIDQRIGRDVYAGAEFAKRDLTTPIKIADLAGRETVTRSDREEKLARAYVYWTASDRVSASAEYLFESFDREGVGGTEDIVEVDTHRIPLSVRYFDPSGVFGTLKATHVRQRGTFSGTTPTTGEDNFWVFDAALGYRLPKRYGVISVEVRNLLDEEFRFQDTEPERPFIQPDRLVLFNLTLAY